MTLVTVPQSNPNDEITALAINQGPNAIATVVNGQLDDTNISALSGSKIAAGTLPASSSTVDANPETRQSETIGDIVASGLVWSSVSGLNGTMTSGVAYTSGKRLIVAAIASYTFTASKDTYIYVDSTGTVQYSPQTNGVTQPATPANNQLIAKVITGASTITSVFDLRVITVGSPWRTFTSTWTAITTPPAIGNGSAVIAWSQVGKTVYWRLRFLAGTTTTFGTGSWRFSLPIAANVNQSNAPSNPGTSPGSGIGTWYAENPGVAAYGGFVNLLTPYQLVIQYSGGGASLTQVSSTQPANWSNTWYIMASGSYEAA